MNIKRILTPLLIILLLLPIVVMGAPTYVNVGPTTDFEGDVGVPDGSGYYINDILFSTLGLIDISTLAKTDGGIIVGDGTNFVLETGATARTSLGLGNVENLKVKLDATQAPTVNNDVDEGYAVGSRWVDVTNDKEYVCLDNTDGAAVWTETTGAGGGASELSDLSDVGVTTKTDKFVLVADGDSFESRALVEADISDLGSYAASGANTDITSILNAALYTGRDADNKIDWATDNHLKIKINGTESDIVSISTGTGDNDKLVTQGYVDDEVAGGTGYTNLTSFVAQNAFKVFYSDTAGDVKELALGADGTYLMSNGEAANPTFETPAGGGDMLKATYDINEDGDIDVAAGGTEKSIWTLYAIPYLSGTTAFGEIAIGTAEYALTVAAGATGYDWTLFDLSLYYLKTEVDTQGEMETIWGDTLMNDLEDDTDPDLGGELDAGAHSIGFTLQTFTAVDDTTTIDWTLGNKFEFTFDDENQTFTFTPPTNPCNLMLWLIQDGVGSRTITWPNTCRWPNGTEATLSTAANAVDIVGLAWNGTYYDCVANNAFAVPE